MREAIVRTEAGTLRGTAREGLHAFLGVPYAQPPVGSLRWRAPHPAARWDGVRDATRFAPQCLQPPRKPASVYAQYAGEQPMSEDCLCLNVFTPSPDPEARLPVMVWIHGGAFQQGAGSNPVFVQGDLPRRGVVLVTFNYRLGPFGFLAHPQADGNAGLRDMAAALAWVQRNIRAFGGDADRVTVFGQSAGAAAVIALMASPRTQGLFAQAMAHSFGISRMQGREAAQRAGTAFVEALGLRSLDEARGLDGETLLARSLASGQRFMPDVDGEFLAEPVQQTFAEGRQQHVPLVIGWNADEGTTFPAADNLVAWRAQLARRFGARAGEAATLWPAGDDAQARLASMELFGDDLFAWGAWRAACDHAPVAPTWLYHFTHRQPFRTGQQFAEAARPAELGAFHSSEYPYVFGTTQVLDRDWGEADRVVGKLMQSQWRAFAGRGDPNGTGLPTWPRLAPAAGRALRLAPSPEAIPIPHEPRLRLLDAVTPPQP
jgi:para-nitrobenzyl esterase